MILNILHGTPTWVFVLFLALLAIGYSQTRPRNLAPARVALLPAAFLAFSLYGVISAFGSSAPVLVCWAGGIAAAVFLNRALKQPRGISWDPAAGSFHIPGSWAPLALMMLIFFTRYAITVSLALQPSLAGGPGFPPLAGFAYGLMSGTFLARALHVWSKRAESSAHSVQSS
jgi:hypothetical protein